MTTDPAYLEPAGPGALTDCGAFLARLLRLDPGAAVRLQAVGGHVTLWARPLGVVVGRQLQARMAPGDLTVAAGELLAVVDGTSGRLSLPPARDASWRASLPPPSGWAMLDVVPVRVLRELAEHVGRLVRSAPDPPAAGESLLDQDVLRVSRLSEEVVLQLRTVAVLVRMGFLGAADRAGYRAGDVVHVACTSAWARLAARNGTAYQRRHAADLGLA